MAIKSNVDTGTLSLVVADNVLVNSASSPTFDDVSRYAISALSLYNTTSSSVTVTIYRSPDTTSASGTILDVVVVPANSQADAGGLIGLSVSLEYIICTVSAVGVNATAAVITYGTGE